MARTYPRGRHPASLGPEQFERRADVVPLLAHANPASLTSAEIAITVRAYASRWSPQHPAAFDPDELQWHYEPAFAVEELGVTPASWEAWQAGRVAAATTTLESWWRGRQAEYPVVVVEGRDGRPYVWNGMRRLGLTVRWGLRTVPAFVGIARR